MRKEITEEQITELMRAIPRAEEVERLRGEIEQLTRERDEERAEVERLRDEDTKTRHALRGWVWVCPDGGDEPTHERVSAVVAEVERLRDALSEAALLCCDSAWSCEVVGSICSRALEAKP